MNKLTGEHEDFGHNKTVAIQKARDSYTHICITLPISTFSFFKCMSNVIIHQSVRTPNTTDGRGAPRRRDRRAAQGRRGRHRPRYICHLSLYSFNDVNAHEKQKPHTNPTKNEIKPNLTNYIGESAASVASAAAAGVLANNGVRISSTSHELIYVAFDVVYLGGQGAAEVFARAGLQPCAVRGRRFLLDTDCGHLHAHSLTHSHINSRTRSASSPCTSAGICW